MQVGPLAGEEFPVEIPSTVSVLMQFEQGGQAQSLYSTDSPLLRHGVVEITGTEGTIVIPDPNTFGGAITITRPLAEAVVPPAPVVQEVVDVPQEGVLAGRGLGLLDMARSIRAGSSARRDRSLRLPRARHAPLDRGGGRVAAVRAGGEHGRRGRVARGRLRPAGRDALTRGAAGRAGVRP